MIAKDSRSVASCIFPTDSHLEAYYNVRGSCRVKQDFPKSASTLVHHESK